jgi:assimilatory nitrate reductase catalytic subunit
MGFAAAFAYGCAADIFREHAALSAFENGGRRDFDIGALAAISDDAFDALDPVQWPLRAGHAAPHEDRRFFMQGGFYTADRKARFIAVEPPAPKVATSKEFPFRLNTGRLRDQWHTMTRSGLSARLGAHMPEPFVEVHPADAKAMDLGDGGFARVATRWGACVLKVTVTDRQRAGSLFAPIHWSDATASSARIGDLVMPETDRYSGQPDAKATPASIAPVAFAFRGFALTRRPIRAPAGTWWARVAVTRASGLLLATNDGPEIWRGHARQMFCDGAELAEYVDLQRGIYRTAAFVAGELTGSLFIGPAEAAPQWDAVKALFEVRTLGRRPYERGPDRVRLLQRRARHHPRRDRNRRRRERRGHRRGAARRHQLRLVPARAQAHRRRGGRRRGCGVIASNVNRPPARPASVTS